MERIFTLSTAGLNLPRVFSPQRQGVYRKDYIRDGKWRAGVTTGGETVLEVTPQRRALWVQMFNLMKSRGITVPLTVDHDMVPDAATGRLKRRPLSPEMAEAKRGNVVSLFNIGAKGMFEVIPADGAALELMNRCPEVSLDLQFNYKDGMGNVYPEAITAITLTPMPMMPGQEDFTPVPPAQTDKRVYMSAVLSSASKEQSMTPEQLAKLKTLLKLPPETSDEVVHHEVMEHMSRCLGGAYMSRVDADKARDEAVAAAVAPKDTEIAGLKTQLAAADAKAGKLTLSNLGLNADVLEESATNVEERINRLEGRYLPGQLEKLKAFILGTSGQRPLVCLSRTAAAAAGLTERVASTVLDILEAGTPAELVKLLQPAAGNAKVELARPAAGGNAEADYDPKVTERMIANANQTAGGGLVL